MHLAVLLWGFTGVLGRAIALDSPVLVWYRMLLTALFMAVILFYRRQWVPIARRDMALLVGVGVLMGMHWTAFYGSVKLANVSIALVCLSTASIFTPLFDPIINKGKFDVKELLLGSLAIAGVYLIYRFQQVSGWGWGILSGVVAALLSSIFTVLNKRVADKYPARTMVFYEMLAGWAFISLLLPALIVYMPAMQLAPHNTPITDWHHNDWLWLVVMSLCCTVWAQSLAMSALRYLTSFTATLSVNLEPVYGIILAFLIYNENRELIFLPGTSQLNMGFLAGMGLILLSVILQMGRLLKPRFATFGYIREKGGIE